MRRSILLTSAILMFALVFAACGDADSTEQPGFGTPAPGGELGQGTIIPGDSTVPTDTLSTEPAEITVEPTLSVTEEVTGTVETAEATQDVVQATETMTSSEMIPVTAGQPDGGRISNLLDFEIRTSEGDVVGEVEDIVLNLDARRAQYVIIGVGGFLGIGEKEVAVPWGAFDLQNLGTKDMGASNDDSDGSDTQDNDADDELDDQRWLILDMDKQSLENAPDWDPASLPALGTPAADWDADLRGYWDAFDAGDLDDSADFTTTPEADTDANMNVRLQGAVMASDVIGMDILNEASDTVAVLEDIVINVNSGKVRYVIVSVFAGADLEDALVPIPPAAFSVNPDLPALVVVDADTVLVDAPRFKVGEFPYTLDPEWDVDVITYWRNLDIDVEVDGEDIGQDD